MFIGLGTCFFYAVVATYITSDCHAVSNSSTNTSTGLDTSIKTGGKSINLSSGRTTPYNYSTKQSTELEGMYSYRKSDSSGKIETYATELQNSTFLLVKSSYSPPTATTLSSVKETGSTYSTIYPTTVSSNTTMHFTNLELTTTYLAKKVTSTAGTGTTKVTVTTNVAKTTSSPNVESTVSSSGMITSSSSTIQSTLSTTKFPQETSVFSRKASTTSYPIPTKQPRVTAYSMVTSTTTVSRDPTMHLGKDITTTTTYLAEEVTSTAGTGTTNVTVTTNVAKTTSSPNVKSTVSSSGMITSSNSSIQSTLSTSKFPKEKSVLSRIATRNTTTYPILTKQPTVTAYSMVTSTTTVSRDPTMHLGKDITTTTTYLALKEVMSTAGTVTNNVTVTTNVSKTTSSPNVKSTVSSSGMITSSNSTIQPTLSTSKLPKETSVLSRIASSNTTTYPIQTKQPTVTAYSMVTSTNLVSTQFSSKASSNGPTSCSGVLARRAAFPTKYKVLIIVCLTVVLILLVGCIIERKRRWNIENSKETRNGHDIEAIPLTMECTTATTAINPIYTFGDRTEQKEGSETSPVDQEPGSKSESVFPETSTKQIDGIRVVEIELHPQSQKNTGGNATSSDAVDSTTQPSTSKVEDGHGDSDKESGKDGGECVTSKPEVASSKSECAPKEADVKQAEPSTKPVTDELGPQSQGDTPGKTSDGVQDIVQRSSLSDEVVEAIIEGLDNKNGKDGGEGVSGKPDAAAEPAAKTNVEQVDHSTQGVSADGQQPQLREVTLGDIKIKEMKLF